MDYPLNRQGDCPPTLKDRHHTSATIELREHEVAALG
jgi:hypothetical protein